MGNLHEEQRTFLIISRSVLLKMRNISNKTCRKNENILHLIYFFLKYCFLWNSKEKYFRTGQATDDHTAHAGYLGLQTHTQNMI